MHGETAVAFQSASESKIRDMRLVLGIEKDIRRLEVAMQDAALMRVMNGARHLHDDRDAAANVLWTIGWTRKFPRERSAFHQFHGVEEAAIMFAYFINGNDMRMIEARARLSFAAKTAGRCFPRQVRSQYHFQRHHAIQAPLPRAINDSHAAARDFIQELVVAEFRPVLQQSSGSIERISG